MDSCKMSDENDSESDKFIVMSSNSKEDMGRNRKKAVMSIENIHCLP